MNKLKIQSTLLCMLFALACISSCGDDDNDQVTTPSKPAPTTDTIPEVVEEPRPAVMKTGSDSIVCNYAYLRCDSLATDTVLYSIYFTSADILNSTPSTEFDQIAIDQIAIHFQANRSEGLPTGTFTAFTIWGKNKFGDLSIKTDKSLQLHITQKDSLYTIETNDLSSSGSKSENDIVSFTFYNRLHQFTDEEVLAATEGKLGLLIKDPVEQMPEFPGGTSALMTWLNRNITYPTIAEENGIQGRVTCSFVVERDGSVTDVKVVVSVDVSLDKEAVRVLSMMPKWNPGMLRGNFVRVRYSVPITFRLLAKRKTARSLNENSGTISYDDIKYTILEDY